MKEETLIKSIDELLDDVFSDDVVQSEEVVEKSIAGKPEAKADEAMKEVPKAQKDEDRKAGRPKQISDVPQKDEDGKREGQYDDEITENEDKEDEPKETDQVKVPEQMKKSLSDEEYEEYQQLKKAKEEAEQLKKAEVEKNEKEALIKAAVDAETQDLKKSLEEIKKVAQEQSALLKSLAKTPVQAKSIQGIESLEKSSYEEAQKTFSKADMLDAAEELVKSGTFSSDVVTELEMTGTIYNKEYRKAVERQLNKK